MATDFRDFLVAKLSTWNATSANVQTAASSTKLALGAIQFSVVGNAMVWSGGPSTWENTGSPVTLTKVAITDANGNFDVTLSPSVVVNQNYTFSISSITLSLNA